MLSMILKLAWEEPPVMAGHIHSDENSEGFILHSRVIMFDCIDRPGDLLGEPSENKGVTY
jgi:hypothetical protein